MNRKLAFTPYSKMKLTNKKGESFELRIVDYQFPENQNDYYDSNWLMILVTIDTPQTHCEILDPGLLTWELPFLAQWLSDIGTINTQTNLGFIEPTVSFALIFSNTAIRVTVRDSVSIKSEIRKKYDTKIKLKFDLDFELDEEQIDAAILSIAQELENYPQRAKR